MKTIDKNGRGVIIKKEHRDLLYTFMLLMTKDEFTKLWAMWVIFMDLDLDEVRAGRKILSATGERLNLNTFNLGTLH